MARATEPSAKVSALPVDTVTGSSNTASAPDERTDFALKYLSIIAGSPLCTKLPLIRIMI